MKHGVTHLLEQNMAIRPYGHHFFDLALEYKDYPSTNYLFSYSHFITFLIL